MRFAGRKPSKTFLRRFTGIPAQPLLLGCTEQTKHSGCRNLDGLNALGQLHIHDEISDRGTAGYVEQFDTLLPELTVTEMLMYTAELKRKRREPLAVRPKVAALHHPAP